MPFSSELGKDWIVEKVTGHFFHSVLDVGPGSGTYHRLLNELLPGAHWTCIEIWEPYVEQFGLRDIYDSVIVRDALDVPPLGSFDLAIFGDVVEHVERESAERLVLQFDWRSAIISMPVCEYPQGAHGGNPHEAHLATWSVDDVHDIFGHLITDEVHYPGDGGLGWVEEAIGVFWLQR
jgi:hypothetical protein